MTTSHRIFCAGLLALAAGGAAATDLSPGYVGASYNAVTNYTLPCTSGDECQTQSHKGGKVYAGYTLGADTVFGMDISHAVEFGLFDLGRVREVMPGFGYMNRSVSGATLTYASALRLSDAWSFDTRFGVAYVRSKSNFVDTEHGIAYDSDTHIKFGPTGGLGLAYALDKHWALTADVDYMPVKFGVGESSSHHANTMSLGAAYHF